MTDPSKSKSINPKIYESSRNSKMKLIIFKKKNLDYIFNLKIILAKPLSFFVRQIFDSSDEIRRFWGEKKYSFDFIYKHKPQ